MQAEPDYYCWNSGSSDPDPFLIGIDSSLSLYDWQKHDLEFALLAARRQNVPLLISTAGDTGTDSRVDLYVECLRHLSQKHNLPSLTLAYFYTEVPKHLLDRYSEQVPVMREQHNGKTISETDFEQTDRVLSIAGAHPYLRALETGADIIIGGRSCQTSMIAAVALHQGFPASTAYSLGYVLGQYQYAAIPGQALLGAITDDTVKLCHLVPPEHQNGAWCPVPAPADLTHVQTPDGMLDVSACDYHRIDDATIEIRNAAFLPPDNPIQIHLEGVGKVGERHVGILSVSDSAGLDHLEGFFDWTLTQIADHFTGKFYQLTYQVYEQYPLSSASSPSSEPSRARFLLIEGIAETGQLAEELTIMATRILMTAGSIAKNRPDESPLLTLESILAAPPVYRWTIQHTLPLANSHDFFKLHVVTLG